MLNELEIIYLFDSEISEEESMDKGYRNDVYVKCDGAIYHIRVYNSIRLIQDFEMEVKEYGFYAIDPNLVLVTEVSKKEIAFVVGNLYENKFFDELKPVEEKELERIK